MRLKKFILPMSIILLLVLALAGTYYVRLRILEKQMVAAVERNDKATVVKLAHSFPSLAKARDKQGVTPLFRAAQWRDRGLVDLLLSKGADVNAKTAEPILIGRVQFEGHLTPLHFAAGDGQTEIVAVLLAHGADPNAKDDFGWTPLHLASNGEIADLLISKGADIKAKANKGRDGWTPLHTAALWGNKQVVEHLISYGADINAKDNSGRTPLQLAMENNYAAVAEVLRKAGAAAGPQSR